MIKLHVFIEVCAIASLIVMVSSSQQPSPSWKCRVCEDVVQTFHDRYKCMGGSLKEETVNPFSPDANTRSVQTCQQPKLDCNDLDEELKPVCKAMRYQFVTRKQPLIWSMTMDKGDTYDTCVALGKCLNDTEQADAHDCRLSFRNESCKTHLKCAPVEDHCSTRCFLCYHLVRDWPMFQQTCKPAGAKVEAEAFLDEEKVQLKNGPKPGVKGGSFVESSAQVARTREWSERAIARARELRRRADEEADRLAGPFGAPPSHPSSNIRRVGRGARAGSAAGSDFRPDYLGDWSLLQVMQKVSVHGAYEDADDEQMDGENEYQSKLERERAIAQHQQQTAAAAAAAAQQSNALVESESEVASEGEETATAPVVSMASGDTLPLECHKQWDDIIYSKKARYFVQWLQEVAITPSPRDRMDKAGLWDANIVCKCLGVCELSKFESLGLIEVCKYDATAQQTMDIALAEYIRDKPHDGKGESEEED